MVSRGEYAAVCHVLDSTKRQLSSVRKDLKLLRDRLRRAECRESAAVAKAVAAAKIISVKQKGRVPHSVRALIRDWSIICNVPSKKVFPCIRMFCNTFGLTLRGSFSHGLVGLAVLEGGLAARLQIAAAITDATGCTMSNDGTSHRNQHFSSHYLTVKLASGLVRIFNAGLRRVPNKSAEQQETDWRQLLQDIWDFFNSSPLGSAEQLSAAVFLRILCATTGDHASDQRKLNRLVLLWKQATDRLQRGHEAMDALPDVQYHGLVAEVVMERIEEFGDEAWDDLSQSQREVHVEAGLEDVAVRLGWERFNELDAHAQASVDFFFHFGCEMHKELNTVVSGNKAMQAYWAAAGLAGPIQLMNKDNAAAAASGTSVAKARAERVSQAGGAKTVTLAGGILRNKDSKKGQQRKFNTWMTHRVGRTIEFPDVARSRFQTVCLGAGFLLLRLELVIEFLELVRDAKDTPGFTNMELNVHRALHDPFTRTELGALALYPLLVTIPYIIAARKVGANALDFSPRHEHVKAHCRWLAAHLDQLFDIPLAESYKTTTLDGEDYFDAEIVGAVLRRYHAGELPELRDVLTTFLIGAADGWDHFASEFDEGSVLATASADDLARCHVDATNDRNEHGLAGLRRISMLKPNATTESISSTMMYRDNDTGTFVETLPDDVLNSLLPAARAVAERSRENAEGAAEVQLLEELAAQHREKAALVQQQRSEQQLRLDSFTDLRIKSSCLIPEKITVKQLEPELEWHRYRGLAETHTDKIPMVKKRLPNRAAKLEALIRAIDSLERWLNEGNALQVHQAESGGPESIVEDYMDVDEE